MAAVLAALAVTTPGQRQFDELRRRALPADDDENQAVASGDVDGDGDMDLVFGGGGYRTGPQQSRLYLNDGGGTYTDATATRMPAFAGRTRAVAFADFDGDGDLDLVLGNRAAQNRLYLNDGTGTFADATATHLPADGDDTRGIALGDVDGDGDFDIVFGNTLIGGNGQNRLYINDGSGVFGDVTGEGMPEDADGTLAVALGDVDGDGDLDLVCGNGDYRPEQSRLYLNDGRGAFADATAGRMPADNDATSSVALGDVDGDGDLDMVLGNGVQYPPRQNRLLLNDGTGLFADATATGLPAVADLTSGALLHDVDGDGDLDLIVANTGQDRLYANDGIGRFSDVTAMQMPADLEFSRGLAVGDVDGDGDPDIALARGGPAGRQNRLYLNDGAGRHADATATRSAFGAADCVAFADVDADGDLDALLGTVVENRLHLNDGTGGFADVTAERLPADRESTFAVALGDVDGDGDLDIVFANSGTHPRYYYGAQNRLYLNDGAGTFAPAVHPLPTGLDNTRAAALGDVDGDGDLDLVLGNYGHPYAGGQNRLLLNDGAGAFADATAQRMPKVTDLTSAVALGDVDGDGDLDIVFGNGTAYRAHRDRLYLNDGTGAFVDATAAIRPLPGGLTQLPTSSVALTDVDGDGDLDLIAGAGERMSSYAAQNRLYLNDGTGTFDEAAGRLPKRIDGTRSVVVGDVDADGDADIVFGNGFYGVPLGEQNRLYVNDGSGVFGDATVPRLPVDTLATGALALADVDGDDDLDLFVGNAARSRLQLNLARHLDAPYLLRVGQAYTLEAWRRYGPPTQADAALPFLSTGRASLPLPPFGILGLDPTQMVPLPGFVIPPEGVGSLSFTVPRSARPAGLSIYAQALLVSVPFAARLSNVTADTLLP